MTAALPLEVASAEERETARREGREHITVYGHLEVPCASSWDRAPERPGWQPFFVNVKIGRRPVEKWITYRRTEAPFSQDLWDAYKAKRALTPSGEASPGAFTRPDPITETI